MTLPADLQTLSFQTPLAAGGLIASTEFHRRWNAAVLALQELDAGLAGLGAISALTGDVTATGPGSVAAAIANNAVSMAKLADLATDRLIGRDTAGTGDPEALTVGGGIEFTGSGGIQTSALTGDVTKAAGGTALTIANDAVTYAKMQNVSAASRLIGRGSAGGAGDPEEISLGTGLSLSGTTLNAAQPGLTQLGTGTANGSSSTISFTSIAATYKRLWLLLLGIQRASDGDILLRWSTNNGSSYNTYYTLSGSLAASSYDIVSSLSNYTTSLGWAQTAGTGFSGGSTPPAEARLLSNDIDALQVSGNGANLAAGSVLLYGET